MIFKPANIISIILACLCIYGGSGFYLATFCCADCETKGIETILSEGCHTDDDNKNVEDSCCSNIQSHKTESSFESGICGTHCSHASHCSIETYQFDLDNFVQKIRYDISVIDLLFEPFDFVIAQESYFTIPKLLLDDPLPSTSRDVLLNNSVLLI